MYLDVKKTAFSDRIQLYAT